MIETERHRVLYFIQLLTKEGQSQYLHVVAMSDENINEWFSHAFSGCVMTQMIRNEKLKATKAFREHVVEKEKTD